MSNITPTAKEAAAKNKFALGQGIAIRAKGTSAKTILEDLAGSIVGVAKDYGKSKVTDFLTHPAFLATAGVSVLMIIYFTTKAPARYPVSQRLQ